MTRATTTVNPVDFETTNALVESSRMAFSNVTKGKILACRTPDLVIKFNRYYTSAQWDKYPIKKEEKV
jgi:hypothetical protein